MLKRTYLRLVEMQEEQARQHLEEVRSIHNEMRGYKHDFHHHLQALKGQLEAGQVDRAIAYLEQLDRGVTILHGEGGYTHESSAVLLSIVSNRELPRLEKLAHSIDPTCFLIVSHVTEVSGRGFSMDKDYL